MSEQVMNLSKKSERYHGSKESIVAEEGYSVVSEVERAVFELKRENFYEASTLSHRLR